jgi:hypothetical protein
VLTEVCRFKSPQDDSGFWPKAAEWCNAESPHLSEDKLSFRCNRSQKSLTAADAWEAPKQR